jgi:diketogulonate reductase-like aldo/keto reductase
MLATASAAVGKTVEIAPGVIMPSINLGTCCGSDPKIGLGPWLDAGATGIDTAFDYHDQVDIAAILKQRKVKRETLFITTKVPAGFGNATDCMADPNITIRYIQENLRELQIDQVDLLLLHRPCQPSSSSRGPAKDPTASNNALWKGAQMALAMNLTRAIGVSNYVAADLKALDGPTPSVNQCQMSLHKHDDVTIQYCIDNKIQYESYQAMKFCPFTNAELVKIATGHGKSAAQVCLRWVLEREVILASGTGSDPTKAAAYAKENLGIYDFSLTADEMKTLNGLGERM